MKRGRGKPFAKGNPGKPKGAISTKVRVSSDVAALLARDAIDTVEALMNDVTQRGSVRLEAAKTVLAYAWGLPRQTVDLLDVRAIEELRRIEREDGIPFAETYPVYLSMLSKRTSATMETKEEATQ